MSGRTGIIAIIILMVLPACEDFFFQDDTTTSPSANFEALWHEFDLNYAYFEYKNVDWDSLYDAYVPGIDENTTEEQLFRILAEMISTLRDGHVSISSPFAAASYNFHNNISPTINWVGGEALADYLVNVNSKDDRLFYSKIKGTNIGYLWINSFGGAQETFSHINEIIEQFEDTDGMIIDLRMNGGGSDANSEIIVSRFADNKYMYRQFRFRNGPAHDDFTQWYEDYIEPEGEKYQKPVIVLINNYCFSATESCILAFRELPQVTIVGDTTGGGSGNPLKRELPNGWIYRLSNWQEIDANTNYVEGKGIAPDSLVWISKSDSLAGIDRILEAGIGILQSR